jgi:glutamine amidotransferase PdxT
MSSFTGEMKSKAPVVGIFAIQGAVEEHANSVRKCGGIVKEVS